MQENAFINIPVKLFDIPLSNDARMLYGKLRGLINYSNFRDQDGKYFYISKNYKEKIKQELGITESRYKHCMRSLRDSELLITKQLGTGVRVYFAVRKEDAEQQEAVGQNLTDPVGQELTDPLKNNNGNTINYSMQLNITAVSISNNKGHVIPEFMDVLKYWKDKGYKSNPFKYWQYYDDRCWTIGGDPVRNWMILADRWEQTEFTSLPPEFYTQQVTSLFPALPDYIREAILKDQEKADGYVTTKTLNLLQAYLQKQNKSL